MSTLASLLGNTDIYLLDQIMKGRYVPSEIILDAGAGGGRNLQWFVQEGFQVFGTDRDPAALESLRQNYPDLLENQVWLAPLESLPFPAERFNHIICSAVLHFAEDQEHFEQMFREMVRVLRPDGSLFIRVATVVGLEAKIIPLGHGRFHLPDGSDRFLLTRPLLDKVMLENGLRFLETFKTVLVDDLRSMAVLVLGKTGMGRSQKFDY